METQESDIAQTFSFSLPCLFQKQKAPFIAPNASSFWRTEQVKNTIIILIHLHLTGDRTEGRKEAIVADGGMSEEEDYH